MYSIELNFHHDYKNESRWLAVGCFDRQLKVYDLTNMTIVSSDYLKSRVSAGCWPIHWTTILSATDNALCLCTLFLIVLYLLLC